VPIRDAPTSDAAPSWRRGFSPTENKKTNNINIKFQERNKN
jgi:hypothetical protein